VGCISFHHCDVGYFHWCSSIRVFFWKRRGEISSVDSPSTFENRLLMYPNEVSQPKEDAYIRAILRVQAGVDVVSDGFSNSDR
jgi:hypothetical protein